MYLLEGNRCPLGFILPHSIPGEEGKKKFLTTGLLFSTKTHLDNRDPIFTTLDGIKLRNSSQTGTSIQISTKRTTYECTPEVIKKFAEICRTSPQLRKEFPQTEHALRECLVPLQTVLSRTRPLKGMFLVPYDFSRGESTFLQYRNLIIVSQGAKLVHFYDRKGKGETAFLKNELVKLKEIDKNETSVRGFSIGPPNSFSLGKIWIKGMSFQLHPDAIKQYMRLISRSKTGSKLAGQYTLQRLLREVVPAFIRAQPMNDEACRKLPLRSRQSGAKYRRFADWVFVVTDKNVFSSCFIFRERKVRKNSPAAPKPATEIAK